MKTPVIIPAHNEEAYIAATLSRLPSALVEPIIAVNGSEDRTAEIARSFGCTVLEEAAQGKLPAIQKVLQNLGNVALGPILILDGDTKPIFPNMWHNGMVKYLSSNSSAGTPQAVGAPALYNDRGFQLGTIKTLDRIARAIKTRSPTSLNPHDPKSMVKASQYGPNMGIHLKSKGALDAVLSLPHYWPGEDVAIVATILSEQGTFSQPLDPSICAISPASESLPSARQIMTSNRAQLSQTVRENYTQRGAQGSIPYVR